MQGDEITLFPVIRSENYESTEEDSLSHQTTSLIYTLAACYLLDLVFIILYVGTMLRHFTLAGKNVPVVMWLGVIFGIVCIFRVVFCFVYIDDGFSELSEYAVFEIPTFLLFTWCYFGDCSFCSAFKKEVCASLCLFVPLSYLQRFPLSPFPLVSHIPCFSSTFDFRSQDKKIWIVGSLALICVWSLFIIITVVYGVVILEVSLPPFPLFSFSPSPAPFPKKYFLVSPHFSFTER